MIITENIYSELKKLGLTKQMDINIEEIRSQNGVCVYRVEYQNKYYVLKYFEKDEFTREIQNYKILSELGIQTIAAYGTTEKSVLLEDISKSEEYRLGIEADLLDLDVAKALAKWYIELHDKGEKYLSNNNTKLYREIDIITKDNIKLVMEKSNTGDKEVWKLILNNIDQIIEKTKALGETLTYNDFYWTNFIVKKDKSEAFMFDYNLMGIGLRYFDIRNVTSSMSPEAGEVFVKAYGNYNRSEKIIDDFLGIIFTLVTAYQREKFPKWAEDSLVMLSNGTLEKSFRKVIELPIMK